MYFFRWRSARVPAAMFMFFLTIHSHAVAQEAGKAGGAPDISYPSYDSPKDIPPHVFAKDAGISAAYMSPDGKHYLTTSPQMGNITVRVESTEETDSERHFLDNVDRKIYDGVYWASSSRIVIQLAFWSFDRNWGWYRTVRLVGVDKDGGNLQTLYTTNIRRDDAYVDNLVVDLLPKEANYILITASPDGKSAPAVFKLDIYTGETTQVMEGRKHINQWLTDEDGNVRMGIGVNDGDMVLIARTASNPEWLELHNNELFEDGRFFPLSFDFDGSSMFVRSAVANGRFAIYRFDLTSGKLLEKLFEHTNVDARGIEISNVTRQLQAVNFIEDKLSRHFFDPEYERLHTMVDKALPGRSNFILDRTPDDHFFLIYSVSDRYPGALYRLDAKTKHMVVLGEMNNGINPALMAETVRVNYFARDGLEIPAYMTAPTGVEAKNLPAVILPHGWPQMRNEIEYDELVQFIASRGYLVLQPNYRGSTGYSYEYQSLGYGEWGGAMQTDLEDAAAYLVDEGLAAEGKVCIMGQSAYASYAALLGAMKAPDRFACAVAVSPILDLAGYAKAVRKEKGKLAEARILGDRKSKDIKAASPVELVKSLERPLLMFHGKNDRIVPEKEFEKFEKALGKQGKTFKIIKSDEDGSGLGLPKTRTRFYRELETFLLENLGPGTVKSFAPTEAAEAETETSPPAGSEDR